MSGFDPQLLYSMGIEETQFDFSLPDYLRFQMSRYVDGGMTLFHSQPRSLSEIALIRLILQITNLSKFIWLVFNNAS
jgi:hypothetical protein